TRGRPLAEDPELQQMLKQNHEQIREILSQLDPAKLRLLAARLRAALGSSQTDPAKLLGELLTMDDSNFQQRYRIFYDQVGPLVQLYRIKPGDVISLRGFTKAGYAQAVNVRVYGTFRFKGLEKMGAS